MQILVLGTHRSGTSTVSGLIHRMGAYVAGPDQLMEATDANPKGYWERNDARELNDEIFHSLGCKWDELSGWNFPDRAVNDVAAEGIHRVMDELNAQRPWVLKDPRLCLTYPWWMGQIEQPVCVIVHRDPLEIARSLLVRDGIPLMKGVTLWEYYSVGLLKAAKGHPAIHLSYNDLLADPVTECAKLHRALAAHGAGLTALSEAEVKEFVSSELNRSRNSDLRHGEYLNAKQMALIEYLLGRQAVPDDLSVSLAARDVMKDYARITSFIETDDIATRYHTLELRHQELQRRHGEVETSHRSAETLKAELERVYASLSWRLGHRLVRFGRRLTGG